MGSWLCWLWFWLVEGLWDFYQYAWNHILARKPPFRNWSRTWWIKMQIGFKDKPDIITLTNGRRGGLARPLPAVFGQSQAPGRMERTRADTIAFRSRSPLGDCHSPRRSRLGQPIFRQAPAGFLDAPSGRPRHRMTFCEALPQEPFPLK